METKQDHPDWAALRNAKLTRLLAGSSPDALQVQPLSGELGARIDWVSGVKDAFRDKLGPIYSKLVLIFSPVMPRVRWPTLRTCFRSEAEALVSVDSVVVQIGSGPSRIHPAVINLDISKVGEVDLVADCEHLPFPDGSVDAIVSSAVLEHVRDPERVMSEAFRVLKEGGKIVTLAPFLQPFHAAPHDFTRWTREGLRQIHVRNGFRCDDIRVEGGPMSALLWVTQEWLSILLGAWSPSAFNLIWWLLLPVLSPFKLLDALLVRLPQADRLASSFVFLGTKMGRGETLPTRPELKPQ